MTDNEAYSLITLPGFSTNEEVTELSGRGVGYGCSAKGYFKSRRKVIYRE